MKHWDSTSNISRPAVIVAKTGCIAISIMLILLGVVLHTKKGCSLTSEKTPIGIGMITYGLFRIIGFYSGDLYRLAFQNGMELGALQSILGITILTRAVNATSTLTLLVGTFLIVDSLFMVRTVRQARDFGISEWPACLALVIAAMIVGVSLLGGSSVGESMSKTGLEIALITEGILCLFTTSTMVKVNIDQKAKNTEYTKGEERRELPKNSHSINSPSTGGKR